MATEPLEWMLKFDAKLDGLTNAIVASTKATERLATLDKSLKQVTADTSKASEGHKSHGKSVDELSQKFDKLQSSVSKLTLSEAGKWAKEGLHYAKEYGEKLLHLVAHAERTKAVFKNLFGKEGGEMLHWVKAISGSTEFKASQLKSAAMSLGKVGFKGEDLKRAMGAGLDLAAMSENPQEGLNMALASMERIKRTGRIDNRALAGLGLGGDAVFKQLSLETGKSVAAVKKQFQQGKGDVAIGIESLFSLITKRTGKDLGGAGYEMSRTLGGSLTRLADLPSKYIAALTGGAAGGGLSKTIAGIVDALSPDGEIGKSVVKFLSDSGQDILDWLKKLDVSAMGERVSKFFADDMPKWIDTAKDALGSLADVASEILSILDDVNSVINPDRVVNRKMVKQFENALVADKFASKSEAHEFGRELLATGSGAANVAAAGQLLLAGRSVSEVRGMFGLKKNASGGIVSRVTNGVALVEPAPGEGLASIGAGERIVPAGRRSAGGGNVSISAPITVNIQGGAQGADGEQIARTVQEATIGALQSAFEQFQMELGA